MDKIKAIYGQEPPREGEYPSAFKVGSPFGERMVTAIERRVDDYGDHGLGWFDVKAGDDVLVSVAQRAVAEIHYFCGEG